MFATHALRERARLPVTTFTDYFKYAIRMPQGVCKGFLMVTKLSDSTMCAFFYCRDSAFVFVLNYWLTTGTNKTGKSSCVVLNINL